MLGPLSLHLGTQQVPIRGALKHRLLARLALTPRDPVTTDTLIAALWEDRAPRTAKQSLHVHINTVRECVRELTDQADRSPIVTVGDGSYQCGVAPEAIDAHRYERQVTAGLAAVGVGDLAGGEELLRQAIALWGEPYETLSNVPSAMAERHRLAALHERTVDGLADALIAQHKHHEVLPVLRSVVAEAPLREQPYRQLMEVYVKLGERARAISVYNQVAQMLDDELGIEPSTALQAVLGSTTATRVDVDSAELPTPAVQAKQERRETVSGDDEPISLASSTLYWCRPRADNRPFVEQVIAQAEAERRPVLRALVSGGAADSPYSALLGALGLTVDEVDLAAGAGVVHEQLTASIRRRGYNGGVLLIEGMHRARPELVHYLRHALREPASAPFTLVAVGDRTLRDLGPLQALAEQLTNVEVHADELNTVPTTGLGVDEAAVLELISLCLLPAPIEVVARASRLTTSAFATALDHSSHGSW